MDTGTGLLVLILGITLLWVFRRMLGKSAEMAEKEFDTMTRAQEIRLYKTRIKHTEEVQKLTDKPVLTDKEFSDIFNVLNKSTKGEV